LKGGGGNGSALAGAPEASTLLIFRKLRSQVCSHAPDRGRLPPQRRTLLPLLSLRDVAAVASASAAQCMAAGAARGALAAPPLLSAWLSASCGSMQIPTNQ
jgi:hypothetical protein